MYIPLNTTFSGGEGMASMLKSVAKSVLNSMQEVEFMLSGTTPGLSSESTNSGEKKKDEKNSIPVTESSL